MKKVNKIPFVLSGIFSVIGVILGIYVIVMSQEIGVYVHGGSDGDYAVFGADFYTDIYEAVRSISISTYSNLEPLGYAIGILIIVISFFNFINTTIKYHSLCVSASYQEEILEALKCIKDNNACTVSDSSVSKSIENTVAPMVIENADKVKRGDTLSFGIYDDKPIEWVCLKTDDNKMTIIAKNCICQKAYNEENSAVTWETCTLRTWLNKDFYNEAFSDDEKSYIAEVTNSNPDNIEYGTDGGNGTVDKVYLLSLDEAKTYFNNNDDRMKGLNSCWWLRLPGRDKKYAAAVCIDGSLNFYGYNVANIFGIRPVITLKY